MCWRPAAKWANGWAERALDHFADLSVGAVAPLLLAIRSPRTGIGRGHRVSRRRSTPRPGEKARSGSPPPDRLRVFGVCGQAAFFRRSALEAVGGWTAAVGPELADVELAWAFRRAGYRTVLEPAACVYAQALPSARMGAFRQGLYGERLFWRNAAQVGWLKALAAHAWLVGWDTVAHLPHPSVLLPAGGASLCGRRLPTLCRAADATRRKRCRPPTAADRLPTSDTLADRRRSFFAAGHRRRPSDCPERMRTA